MQWRSAIYTPVYETIHVPAIPAQPAIESYMDEKGVAAWDGGARSVSEVEPGQALKCTVKAGGLGCIVGLAMDSPLRNRAWIEYGVQVQVREPIRIIERGIVVQDLPVSGNAYDRVIEIRRSAAGIYYLVDGDLVRVTPAPDTRDLYGAALLYSEMDFVEEYSIIPAPTATVSGEVPPPILDILPDNYAMIRGRLPPLAIEMEVSSAGGGQMEGIVPPPSAIIYDRDYMLIGGRVPPLEVDVRIADEQITITVIKGLQPRPTLYIEGITGEVLSMDAMQPPVYGKLVGRDGNVPRVYGEVGGVWPSSGYWADFLMLDGFDQLDASNTTGLMAYDAYAADHPMLVAIHDGIHAGAAFDLQLIISEDADEAIQTIFGAWASGEITEELIARLLPSVSTRQALLHPPGASIPAPESPFASEALSYAVNIITGAMTEYADADFRHMVTIDGELWAANESGIYRSGGSTLSALLDMGTTDLGSQQSKRVDCVFVGVRTDGDLYLRVTADGREQVYRAIRRGGDMARFTLAKGVSARNWSYQLELVDASYASVDSVEVMIGQSQRRVRGRR